MFKPRRAITFAGCSAFVATLVATGTMVLAEDAVTAAGDQYSVEFENERVRVLRGTYAPGEKSAMHEHPKAVAIQLTGGELRFTPSGGESVDVVAVAGNATWSEAQMHEIENIGDQELVVLIIELKD